MKKPTVIFVHGFRSGRDSSKWQYIKDLPTINAYIFEVNYDECSPDDVLDLLDGVCWIFEDPIIIGHSLGGLYARVYASRNGLQAILLNPSLLPTRTLFNGSERSLPDHLFDSYRDLQDDVLPYVRDINAPAEIVLVERGDDVVQHDAQRHFHEKSMLLELPGGDHSFQSLNMIDYAIEMLTNRPWT